MFSKAIVILSFVSLSLAQNYFEAVEPQVVQYIEPIYEQVPIGRAFRVRRQTIFGDVRRGDAGGTHATIGAQGNILNRNGHSVNAHGQVDKNFHPNSATGVGGGFNYQGPRAGLSGNVNHAHRFGTDVGVSGNANVWRSPNGRSSVDANAEYNRHFGGQFGTGRPNYNVGATFRHRF